MKNEIIIKNQVFYLLKADKGRWMHRARACCSACNVSCRLLWTCVWYQRTKWWWLHIQLAGYSSEFPWRQGELRGFFKSIFRILENRCIFRMTVLTLAYMVWDYWWRLCYVTSGYSALKLFFITVTLVNLC